MGTDSTGWNTAMLMASDIDGEAGAVADGYKPHEAAADDDPAAEEEDKEKVKEEDDKEEEGGSIFTDDEGKYQWRGRGADFAAWPRETEGGAGADDNHDADDNKDSAQSAAQDGYKPQDTDGVAENSAEIEPNPWNGLE